MKREAVEEYRGVTIYKVTMGGHVQCEAEVDEHTKPWGFGLRGCRMNIDDALGEQGGEW